MKKIVSVILLFLSVLLLTGCTSDSSDEARDDLFWQLKKDGIISSESLQIDYQGETYWTAEHCEWRTYYVYKDEKDNLFMINYKNIDKNNEYIYIYPVNEVRDITYGDYKDCEDGQTVYDYENDKKSLEKKYISSEASDIYKAKKKAIRFFNRYTLEKTN